MLNHKGNKMLLSLVPILMQTILAPTSLIFSGRYCQTPNFNSTTVQQKNLDGTIFGVLLFVIVRCRNGQ